MLAVDGQIVQIVRELQQHSPGESESGLVVGERPGRKMSISQDRRASFFKGQVQKIDVVSANTTPQLVNTLFLSVMDIQQAIVHLRIIAPSVLGFDERNKPPNGDL